MIDLVNKIKGWLLILGTILIVASAFCLKTDTLSSLSEIAMGSMVFGVGCVVLGLIFPSGED